MLSFEYTILMTNPKSKTTPYIWKGTSDKDGKEWYESVKNKDKFKGLVPVSSRRILVMNKRINVARTFIWLNIVLLSVLIFKLVTM